MKKMFIGCAVLVALLFTACSDGYVLTPEGFVTEDEYSDDHWGDMFKDIPLYKGDFSEIDSIDDIASWIGDRVVYDETKKVYTPEEIIKRGRCDCDGFALLYMNILYVRFGIKSVLCVLYVRTIIDGGMANHAILQLPDGRYISGETGAEVTYNSIGYKYSFDHVFKY